MQLNIEAKRLWKLIKSFSRVIANVLIGAEMQTAIYSELRCVYTKKYDAARKLRRPGELQLDKAVEKIVVPWESWNCHFVRCAV